MVIRNGPSLAIALTSSDIYGCSQSTNVTKTTLNNGEIRYRTLLVIIEDQSSDLVYLMHKITNLLKFEFNWSSQLQDTNGRKNTLATQNCVLIRCLMSRPQNLNQIQIY